MMSVNSSSNNFNHHNGSDSNNSSLLLYMYCATTLPSSTIFLLYNVSNIVIVSPLCVFVIYLGLQRWRLQRSVMSHSDSFTFNMMTLELIGVLGNILSCCGFLSNLSVLMIGSQCVTFTWLGQMPFIVLTCLEQYLAVIHPVTYLSLRTERGVRIRNIINGCVWFFSFIIVWMTVLIGNILNVLLVVHFCIMSSFCSFTVLYALARQGPGERVRDRDRVGQSKHRAFYILISITAILMVRFFGDLLWVGFFVYAKSTNCFILMGLHWFSMPCSLVLPALFLHRSGKLHVCWKNSSQDEDDS
ncbi:uncharacterized protein LOC115059146 [Echeneis naucrates]|uniref:uncharacterized protein LOC115059146 n=1 Tax=Echeneis naucrates TaxID=173247 RepID=UPI0011135E29|nr:uncharacterized protein LOC115059146 [Echeneis naucrates]